MSRLLFLDGWRRVLADALIIAVIAVGAIDARGAKGAGLIAIGAIVGVTLTLRVHLPRGGSIPMGHAVVIAAAFQFDSAPFAAMCIVALAVGRGLDAMFDRRDWSDRRVVATVVGMVAAGLVAAAVHPHLPARSSDGWAQAALLSLLAIGLAHVAVDVAFEHRSYGWSLRGAAPVYVSLVCSAALIGMAHGWLLVFAALPLAITWYSFERYSAARRAYEQTIQALGIVPELAGHVGIGHGERTASYARALADQLELPTDAREHVVMAARLHHVGHVAVPDCTDTKPAIEDAVVASASGRILRDSGFLPEIADLVESLGAPDERDVVVATLRVASAFDDLVGEDDARAWGALAILQSRSEGPAWQTTVGALGTLLDRGDEVVTSAIAEGAPLTAAAAAAASGVLDR